MKKFWKDIETKVQQSKLKLVEITIITVILFAGNAALSNILNSKNNNAVINIIGSLVYMLMVGIVYVLVLIIITISTKNFSSILKYSSAIFNILATIEYQNFLPEWGRYTIWLITDVVLAAWLSQYNYEPKLKTKEVTITYTYPDKEVKIVKKRDAILVPVLVACIPVIGVLIKELVFVSR